MAEEKKSRYTEAQNRATQKYIRENLEEIKFRVRKGEKDRYKAAAEKTEMSMAKFFLTAADEKMSREAPGSPQEAGVVSLPPDTFKAAQNAAEAAGEALPQFLDRAVTTQAQRDALARKMKGGETK